MAAYDDLNGKRIATISVISIAVTAVTVLAVQVIYFALADLVDSQKIKDSRYTRSNQVLSQQADEISGYGVDPDTGNITIPVSEVMKKMAAESKNRKNEEQVSVPTQPQPIS
ncbi:hypothetical protein [Aporhodopirellula aestuarii]|uniref:Uncharacterized protein n=1 Tax=Aporhodopirellula aestuarii TaxID=2950107 RepID=A0ABT0U2Y8_9BACT|nr:hypothetical protein [Aporhodopirellula aestuarii]MCM2370853.1 hypothetical protein [Aporhodopirellula aestuarii]